MTKYRVKIREVIEHTFEIEEFNEYMAKQKAKNILVGQLRERLWQDDEDIFIEEIK